MRRDPDEGDGAAPTAGSRAVHGSQDRGGGALDALQRLRQGLTIPAIQLQVVDTRRQRFDAHGRTHDEGDGFGFEFAGVARLRAVIPMVQQLVSEFVGEDSEFGGGRKTGQHANLTAAGESERAAECLGILERYA